MNNSILSAIPGAVFASAPVTAKSPEGGVSNRPAGGTLIASTTSGAHFLRTYMPTCSLPNCGGTGHVELVSRMDNSVRLLCLDHGLDRLDALDYGKRGNS